MLRLHWNHCLRFLAMFLATTLLLCGERGPGWAFAAPPGKGGGGGEGTTPTGTIYFTLYDAAASGLQVHAMSADGSNVGAQPLSWGEPSHELHGGYRWFITMRELVRQTYPDGTPRWEYFAVRGDGNEEFTVQLTTQADLQPDWRQQDEVWVPGDHLFSFRAIRWDPDSGEPIGAGIYLASIEFDGDGNVIGLSSQPDPDSPVVAVPLSVNATGYKDVRLSGFSWSSDGRLAWASNGQLFVTDYLLAPEIDTVVAEGTWVQTPAWSPDNSRIAFGLDYDIASVRPDGTDGTIILSRTSKGKNTTALEYPEWSPDGQHLICWRNTYPSNGSVDDDIIRFKSDGTDRDPVSLIGQGIWEQTVPLGWR